MGSDVRGNRGLAEQKFGLAQQELEKGHYDRAEDLGKEALEFDSSFDEVRIWMAELYLDQDQTYQASRQLQDVIYHDRENAQAWEKLRQIDPASANRLATLGNIAPDPFVSAHRAEFESEFEELGTEEEMTGEESSGWGNHEESADLLGEFLADDEDEVAVEGKGYEDVPEEDPEEFVEPEPEVEAAAPVAPTTPPAPAAPAAAEGAGRGAAPWEYEQDREFLQRWVAHERVAAMAAYLRELWTEEIKVVPAYQHAAHMDRARHPEIAAEADKCMHKLGMHDCELLMVAERSLYALPMQESPPRLVIPTGLIRGLSGPELEFHLARELEYIRSGYLAEWVVADLIADRPLRLVGDETYEALRTLLHELMIAHENQIAKEERERLLKLAHAWQQRATLSADRAGWLCCGDLERACTAIAKASSRTLEEAAKMTLSGFLDQFKGAEAAKLAAIPPKELPDRSPAYAAYRIQMLRWWAGTPAAAELRERFSQL